MKKIYDCFPFWQENDLVEIRINQHWPYVEKFIIVEADVTHAGIKKPFNFDEERFEKYKEKIIYVKVEDLDNELAKHPDIDCAVGNHCRGNQMTYRRDQFQCNYAVTALRKLNLQDDDIALVSAADEILNESAFKQAFEYFQDPQREYTAYDFVGSQHMSHKVERGSVILEKVRPIIWFEPQLFIYKLNLLFNDPHSIKHATGVMTEYSNFSIMMPDTMRLLCATTHPPIKNAGWHFSYMDDTLDGQKLLAKMHSWSHCDDLLPTGKRRADLSSMEEAIEQIVKEFDLKIPDSVVSIEDHPKFLLENIDRYQNYLLPV